MARSTLADLIARVRLETGAPSAVFTDDDVQTFLDAHRRDEFRLPLIPVYDQLTGKYLRFYSTFGTWEADAVLRDTTGAVVTLTLTGNPPPDSENLEVGEWIFGAGRTEYYLSIDGKTFDVHAASADLLEAWAAKLALDFDFQSDNQQFTRSQKRAGLLEAAKAQRRKARVGTGKLVRSDELPAHDQKGMTALGPSYWTSDVGRF